MLAAPSVLVIGWSSPGGLGVSAQWVQRSTGVEVGWQSPLLL